MNKNIKINLTAFTGVGIINLTSKAGVSKRCLVIPIDDNYLFEGEKGIYADFIGWEIRDVKDGGATHLVKQSLPKEVREAMTEEERRSLPIFGDIKTAQIEKKELETYTIPGATPAAPAAQTAGFATAPPEPVDDLPFDF